VVSCSTSTAQIERLPGRRCCIARRCAADVARGYLRARSLGIVRLAVGRRAGPGNGITHLPLRQNVDGLEMRRLLQRRSESALRTNHAIERLAGVSRPTPARVDPTALQNAARVRSEC
jgi:hypothetical protein